MRYALYAVWFALPAVFCALAIGAKLEHMSGRASADEAGDHLRQGVFVLGAALASLGLDIWVIVPHLAPRLPEWLPVGVVEVALFPFVLLVLAAFSGSAPEPRPSGGSR